MLWWLQWGWLVLKKPFRLQKLELNMGEIISLKSSAASQEPGEGIKSSCSLGYKAAESEINWLSYQTQPHRGITEIQNCFWTGAESFCAVNKGKRTELKAHSCFPKQFLSPADCQEVSQAFNFASFCRGFRALYYCLSLGLSVFQCFLLPHWFLWFDLLIVSSHAYGYNNRSF